MTDLERERDEISRIDREMAVLFEKRMQAAEKIAAWKKERGLPVRDEARERELFARNREALTEPDIAEYYDRFLRGVINLSCDYQQSLMGGTQALRIRVEEPGRDYPVFVINGGLDRAAELLRLPERTLVLTDEGVPSVYAETLLSQLPQGVLMRISRGEKSKCGKTLFEILSVLSKNNFTRSDGLVALGGGVVGDVGGLAAALYLRGISFYQIPTTLLSQVDSSVGGKTAIDFGGIKNAVGAFYPPKGVLADPALLSTLEEAQLQSGLAEMIKIAAVLDEALFCRMEECGDLRREYASFIAPCIALKAKITQRDPKERGLRRVLNFGHTVGHAAEALQGGKYLHGFCVAMGMPCMAQKEARKRIERLLTANGLPIAPVGDKEALVSLIARDKKNTGKGICAVICNEIGSYEFVNMTPEEIGERF